MLTIKDDKNLTYTVSLIIVLLTVWHLCTLQYTPIPWIDEVYFASMTQSLNNGNGFAVGVGLDNNAYHYGPVYFLLTGAVTKLCGFGLFSFRLVGLVFSYFVAFLVFRILRVRSTRKNVSIAILLILMFDQLFVYCSHIGRMDIVATGFVLLAYLYYYKNKSKYSTCDVTVIAISLLLAALTTPRIIITMVPLGVALIYALVSEKKWRELVVLVLIPVVGYLVWIFLSYGSISSFIEYFTQSRKSGQSQNFISRFVGGSFIISKNHYPLVLASIIVLIHSIINKYYKEVQLYFYTILLFYFVVHSSSDTYSVMILPYYYLMIGEGLKHMQENKKLVWKRIEYGLLVLVACVNFGIFMVKWAVVDTSTEYRDNEQLTDWVKAYIPSGSRVIGTDAYYYACIANDCSFKSLEQVWTTAEDTKMYLEQNYRPEYLFVTNKIAIPEAREVSEMIDKKEVACYSPLHNKGKLEILLERIGVVNKSTYEGVLYKIIYNDN